MEEKVVIKLVCKKEGSEVLTKGNLEWLLSNFYPQGSPYKIISVEREFHKEKKKMRREVDIPDGMGRVFFMGRDRFSSERDDR